MSEDAAGSAEPLRCSARGCTRPAEFAVRWNNPKIHPPERRKTWLACADHRESLTQHLSARGMFRECEPLGSALDDSPPEERPPSLG